MLRFNAPIAGDAGSIPGQGTKNPYAVGYSQNKIKINIIIYLYYTI